MYFKTHDLSIYYEKYGNKKPTILILPGWGYTRPSFYYLINFLQVNYTVYIIDYPGFGNSSLPDTDLTIYDYAEIVKDFINTEKINPTIIAHSFGGRIASILLGKYNLTIKKLILIDVAGIKRFKLSLFLKKKIYRIAKLLISLLPIKNKYLYQKKLFNLFSSSDYQAIPNIMRKTFKNIISEDLRKYYQSILSDTLIIWGEKDLDTPLKDAYYLQKKIINAELIIYEKNGHFSYLERPFLTNMIIDSFLN